MKLNQNDLLKLGLGAAGGYAISSILMPHRGFAKGGGGYRTCNGVDCRHITYDMIKAWGPDACAKACGWDLKQADDYWRFATSDPHGAIGGIIEGGAKEAGGSVGGPGGGGGGGDPLGSLGKSLQDAFSSSVNFLGQQVPVALLVGGGLVLVLLVSGRR